MTLCTGVIITKIRKNIGMISFLFFNLFKYGTPIGATTRLTERFLPCNSFFMKEGLHVIENLLNSFGKLITIMIKYFRYKLTYLYILTSRSNLNSIPTRSTTDFDLQLGKTLLTKVVKSNILEGLVEKRYRIKKVM